MRILSLLVISGVLAAGCGGDSGEPLISGSMTAEFAGTMFTPVNGFATIYQGKGLIVVGTGSVHCGSETSNSPPSGRNAIISIPALAVGSYSNVLIQVSETSGGGFHSSGSNSGSVTITSVTAETVAGTVAYEHTSSSDQKHYAINGSFETVHCQ